MSEENKISIPTVTVNYASNGSSTKANEFGMRPMQELAYEKRGEPYLLIKSPPASGKSRALMFVALDKLANQGMKQAIIVVPERTIGASFHDEPLTQGGFWADWRSRAALEPLRRTGWRRQRRQGRRRRRVPRQEGDKIAWSAPTPPSASPSTATASKPSMTA